MYMMAECWVQFVWWSNFPISKSLQNFIVECMQKQPSAWMYTTRYKNICDQCTWVLSSRFWSSKRTVWMCDL